jgi:hypothetical protein
MVAGRERAHRMNITTIDRALWLIRERTKFREVLIDDPAGFYIEGRSCFGESVYAPALEGNARLALYKALKKIEDELSGLGWEFERTPEAACLTVGQR